MQKPSIGRIVHFVMPGKYVATDHSPHLPGIITAVHDDGTVALAIFGMWGNQNFLTVKHDESGADETWHWPERVDD